MYSQWRWEKQRPEWVSFYLVSWKVRASASLKLWAQEEISHLKRRRCLPCFASIIQQHNSPLGNTEWVLRPLNESKSRASAFHACLSWKNFWDSPTHPKPHYAYSLKWYMDQQDWQQGLGNCIVFFIWCIRNETIAYVWLCVCT